MGDFYPGQTPATGAISAAGGSWWQIRNCDIIRKGGEGIACSGTYWTIENCRISKTVAERTVNHPILVTPNTGAGHHGIVRGCLIENGNIRVSGYSMMVVNNMVDGCMYGAGIVRGAGIHHIMHLFLRNYLAQ